jgi:hypothetical protein
MKRSGLSKRVGKKYANLEANNLFDDVRLGSEPVMTFKFFFLATGIRMLRCRCVN